MSENYSQETITAISLSHYMNAEWSYSMIASNTWDEFRTPTRMQARSVVKGGRPGPFIADP